MEKPQIWVFMEQRGGVLHDVGLELLGKARELAEASGSTGWNHIVYSRIPRSWTGPAGSGSLPFFYSGLPAWAWSWPRVWRRA
jgi:hypothetical protein